MLKKILMIYWVTGLLCSAATNPTPSPQTQANSTSIADIIAEYRQQIPQRMAQENVPGLAIVVVDDQSILWSEGFGYTDWDHHTPDTPDTLFSIQSMSKSFTATAAMFAAQDGLVDLDAPITNYLPDFHVHSIFEEHPEQKMTLRMLLSHTAGFAHETLYGGNYDHPAYSFEQHIASISDTWLKFPVGTRYSYSNLGVDLAGYILQVRSGMPFTQYVQEKVLQPLGVKNSTLDVNQVHANSTRAIGHSGGPLRPPVDFLLIPSGGVWSTTNDMARYLQFHINRGTLDGVQLLRTDLAETMYTPPNFAASDSGYALGIALEKEDGSQCFQHGGGGFGFNSNMIWCPDLKLGIVVLTDAINPNLYWKLSEEVLNSIIASSPDIYSQWAKNSAPVEPAYPPSAKEVPLLDNTLKVLIASKALPDDASAQSRRSAYAGNYILTAFGFPADKVEVSDSSAGLSYTYLGKTSTLTEVEPGLFFSPSGDALDLRGRPPTLTNIRMAKTDSQTLRFRIAFYAICGLVFLSALLVWPIRALINGIRRKKAPVTATVQPVRGPWMVLTGGLSALASLISLVCLVIVALIPNLIYLPWPHPYADLVWWQSALLYLPFASLLLAVGIAVLAGIFMMMKNRASGRVTPIYFLSVALVLLAFNLVLIII